MWCCSGELCICKLGLHQLEREREREKDLYLAARVARQRVQIWKEPDQDHNISHSSSHEWFLWMAFRNRRPFCKATQRHYVVQYVTHEQVNDIGSIILSHSCAAVWAWMQTTGKSANDNKYPPNGRNNDNRYMRRRILSGQRFNKHAIMQKSR